MSDRAPASFRLTGGWLVTQDSERRVLKSDLTVRAGRISAVGKDSERVETTIDASGYAVVPGFINAHTHVAMSLLRGYADDRELPDFLARLFEIDTRRAEPDIEAGAAAGITEMLLGGTTTFLDLYYGQDAVARAVERLGIRGFLGWAVLDPDKTTQHGDPVQNARDFVSRWAGHRKVSPLVAPQGVYVCSEETWKSAREVARAAGTFCHYHLSETRKEIHEHEAKTGLKPPLWLEKIGFLSRGDVAAHGVWLTRREIDTIARHGTGIVHCPSSNLKLASGGVAPVPELREAGVTVGLGTDSNASNNSLSMLREMHTAGLLAKHHRWDARSLPAQTLLDMATIEGARLVGREGELGSLEVGKQADFFLLRLDHPSVLPPRPEALVSHLAYAASEEAVDTVYIGGEPVVEHRRLVREPWSKIRDEAEAAAARLWDVRVESNPAPS